MGLLGDSPAYTIVNLICQSEGRAWGPVADACRQLNERLAPYRARLPGARFKEVVSAAYLERVDLSAHGFYATPDITGASRASRVIMQNQGISRVLCSPPA